MHARQRLPDNLTGVVTRGELAARGLSRWSGAHRGLNRLASGLYVVGEGEWHDRLDAALRIAGPGAAASCRSAACLHGLAPPELPIHVLTQRSSRPRSRDWVTFHRTDLPRRVTSHATPRTALEDTVLDILNESDELEAIAIVTRALQERRTTADRVLTLLDERARVRHRELVRQLLLDAAGVESVLEFIYRERVERPHGLPAMARQFVVPQTGHRADGAYVKRRLLIELDGVEFHDTEADQALDNRHAGVGWSTQRLGWVDCYLKSCETARLVVGDSLVPRRCRRCPRR